MVCGVLEVPAAGTADPCPVLPCMQTAVSACLVGSYHRFHCRLHPMALLPGVYLTMNIYIDHNSKDRYLKEQNRERNEGITSMFCISIQAYVLSIRTALWRHVLLLIRSSKQDIERFHIHFL